MAATYTVKQVAELLGYSTNSIYTFLKEKRIRSVRVGKGRFRIPQSEVNRLLLLSRSADVAPLDPTVPTVLVAPTAAPQPDQTPAAVAAQDAMIDPTATYHDLPSLFDWFIGIASIVLGASMFLFSRHLDEFAIASFVVWMVPIGTALTAAGAGILLTDIMGRGTSWWKRVFQAILTVGYGAFAMILFRSGDVVGLSIFGGISLVLVISGIARLGGVAGFALYLATMTVSIPLVFQQVAAIRRGVTLLASLGISPSAIVVFWISVAVVVNAILWWSYRYHAKIFWFILTTLSGMLITLSLWYTGQMYWGRALFLLVTALVGLILPSWHAFSFSHRTERRLVFLSFGTILFLFLIAVGIVRLVQTALLDFAGVQISNKVAYGRLEVQTTLGRLQHSLTETAAFPLTQDALQKRDTGYLNGMNHSLYEANQTFGFVMTLDATGSALSMFPRDEARLATNFTAQEYVREVRDSRSVVVSDVILSDGVGSSPMVVVAVPVLDRQDDRLLGILVGSIDIRELGDTLHEMASPELKESFIVIDQHGKRIIHPQTELVNTAVALDSPIRLGLQGKSGVSEAYSSGTDRLLIAYDSVPDHPWAIAVQVPMTSILMRSQAGLIVEVLLLILSLVFVFLLWAAHRHHHHVRSGGGSP